MERIVPKAVSLSRGSGNQEIGLVQDVKELGAELQVEALGQMKVLIHRHVQLVEVGSAERVAAQIAERILGRRLRERVTGEIVVDELPGTLAADR